MGERYKEDPEYRAKILEKRKKEREVNSEKIKERKRQHDQTELGKKAHRIRCKRHYDKNPEKQRQRMKQLASTPRRQYTYIKRRAKVANIEFKLTLEEYIELRSTGICYYCKTELSPTAPSIDRLDSSKGYIKENCVPCCLRCNTIKRDILTPEEMLMFHAILRGVIEPLPMKKLSLYTIPKTAISLKKRWSRLLTYTKKKKIQLSLTFEQYKEIITDPCDYCSVTNIGTGYGLDKVIPDSDLGYDIANVVSCCSTCNQIKGNVLTSKEMKILISVIAYCRSN